MTKALRIAEIILVLSMAAFFGVGTYEALRIAPVVRYTVENVNRATYAIGSETATEEKELRSQNQDIHSLIVKSGATMDAATANLQAMQFVVDNLDKTSAALRGLVLHTDRSVNGQVLPQLVVDLKSVNGVVAQMNSTMLQVQEPIRNLTLASAAVAHTTPAVMANVSTTSSNVAATSASMAASAKDAQDVADHWKRVLTRPTTPLKAGLKFVAHWFAWVVGAAI